MRRTIVYGVLVLFSILCLVPMVWLAVSAFKANADFHAYAFMPPPDRLTGANFSSLFKQMPFLRFMMNSFFVAGVTVMVQLFFSSLGGFALAKYAFAGKKVIMGVMLATMMIPGPVLLAPMYELIYHLRLIDSHLGLIVPGMVNVFGMFLFRQSMQSVPDEMLQAARIDGCNEFQIFWHVVIPVSRPIIGAFCLIAFMGTWNSFLWPQIILQSSDRFTLPIGLNQMVGVYEADYGAMMAGTLLAVLPVVVLFFLLQKEFIAGLTKGAVKG
ncbi:sugar ABC transporter permease [Desulfosarcina ovata subsp. sediminis]|uniref:Sugar ABC transporter permease n=1 Tax=Desulfosarcina ovata subsp. sediminis TaxID=885957 RepID=A0A5K7ZS08_9BACT|nr:carbohydrate ABC transporter permease [Desulfosarcina ovata]BBO82999.1 sugar ABC transporter permease [Desulfosarcina ovata subsp. sediminis]